MKIVYFQLFVGSEDEEDHDEMISQLAINMEEMELDPVLMHLMQWASTHFSIVKKIATLHDERIEKETQEADIAKNRQYKKSSRNKPCSSSFSKIFNCPGETKLGGLVVLFSGQNLHQ